MGLTKLEKLEIMEQEMRVSWEEIDGILEGIFGLKANTRRSFGTDWASGKWDIFEKFGRKLSLSMDAEKTSIDEEELARLFDKYLNSTNPSDMFSRETREVLEVFTIFFSTEELSSNKVMENKVLSGEKLSKGMKISKIMKMFIKPEELYDVQTAYSRFIQELKIQGIVEISIDFIDILGMSYNPRNNWRSCHSFVDGEYGGGAFSYATDNSTAIASVFSAKELDSSIRSKQWRQMIYFSDSRNSAILTKQYPYVNASNKETTLKLLNQLSVQPEDFRYGYIEAEGVEDLIKDLGYYHYNDISNDGVSKVTFVVFDDENLEFAGKNGSRSIIREHFDESSMTNEHFTIGVEDLINPFTGAYISSEAWDAGEEWPVYSEEDEDGYYY